MRLEDIKDETLLLLEDGHCLRDHALSVCSRIHVNQDQDYRATSLETLRQMVAAGHGITLLPELAAATPVGTARGLKMKPFAKPGRRAHRRGLAQVHHARRGHRGRARDRARDDERGVEAMTRHPARRLCRSCSPPRRLAWAGDAPVVSDAWARATAPGLDVGAAYMVIQGEPARQAARRHQRPRRDGPRAHRRDEGRHGEDRAIESLPIPAGQPVTLAPNSTHLMLMGRRARSWPGRRSSSRCSSRTEPQVVTVTVRPATASDAAAQQSTDATAQGRAMTSALPPPGAPHRLHDETVEQLLASGERRRELVALLGEDAYRELSALARRARETRRGGPVAYVLPGLMGSPSARAASGSTT